MTRLATLCATSFLALGCSVSDVQPAGSPAGASAGDKAGQAPSKGAAKPGGPRSAQIDVSRLRKAADSEKPSDDGKTPTAAAVGDTDLQLSQARGRVAAVPPTKGPTLEISLERVNLQGTGGKELWGADLSRGRPSRDIDFAGLRQAAASVAKGATVTIEADQRIRVATVLPMLEHLTEAGAKRFAFVVGDSAAPKALLFDPPGTPGDAKIQLGFAMGSKSVWTQAWSREEAAYPGSTIDLGEGHCLMPGGADPSKMAIDVMNTQFCKKGGPFRIHYRAQPLVQVEKLLRLAGLDGRPDDCYEVPVLHTQFEPIALPDCSNATDFNGTIARLK